MTTKKRTTSKRTTKKKVAVKEVPAEKSTESAVKEVPTEKPTKSAVKEETVKEVPTEKPIDVGDDSPAIVKSTPAVTKQPAPESKYRIQTFGDNYVNRMAPGKNIVPSKGAHTQYGFYTALIGIIELPDYSEFSNEFTALQNFFTEHKDGALSGYKIFRFMSEWPGTNIEKQTYYVIVDLVTLFANNTRAKALKQINFDRALDPSRVKISEVGRNNILKYFNVD